jgi:predicted alternative tryptophan synthase beta-subunit
MTRGSYAYDTPDAEGLTPSVQMYTVGHEYVPPGIFAGGMRYHGVSPILSTLYREKVLEAVAHGQVEAYSAGLMFTRAEGILLSPPSMYTVKEVVDQALECNKSGNESVILFSVTPAVESDRTPYDPLLDGRMEDETPPDDNFLSRSLGRFTRR